MTAILILPGQPVLAEPAVPSTAPDMMGPNWALAMLANPAALPVAVGVAAHPAQVPVPVPAPAPVVDPLARWLDAQSGVSAEFHATPDAALQALADGLPPAPDPAPVRSAVPEPVIVEDVAVGPAQPDSVAVAQPVFLWTDSMPMPDAAVPVPVSVATGPALPAATFVAAAATGSPAPSRSARPDPQAQTGTGPGISTTPSPSSPMPQAGTEGVLPHADRRDAPPVAAMPAIAPAAATPRPTAQPDIRAEPGATIPPDPLPVAPAGDTGAQPGLPFDPPALQPAARTVLVAVQTQPQAQADPRPVMQQITDAVVVTREDRTEIALSPEELGRVRLILTGPDRGQITIWAERPETLDLLRRNADLLHQQLTNAGVASGSLDFRREERQAWPGGRDDGGRDDDPAPVLSAARISLTPASLSNRRLDVRL